MTTKGNHEGTKTRKRKPTLRAFESSWLRFFGLSSLIGVAAVSLAQAPPDLGWPINGGIDNIRYSPLTQITRDNVSKLQVAWTYDSHDAFKGSEMQSNPVVVDGVLYATTPTLKVVALNAATGQQLAQLATDATVNAPAMTYTVNDKQYLVAYADGRSNSTTPAIMGDSVCAWTLP